ncbi:MAG: pyridoxamine 5'-phosphate oxidase family protein, partial [Actinobacteria bacterium]|nr:pyridoxamine 5'-phosphate oxidase family protein [Actinomycetota bacterium]
ERLTRAACRQLLPRAPLGRLAVPTPNFPTLEPVSFALVEGELVVAVRPGSAGDAVAEGTMVAFEADVLDHALREGWSVVVGGPVEELDADVASLVRPLLRPWPVAEGDRLLLIRSERISGKRIVAGPDSPADAGRSDDTGASPRVPAFDRRGIKTDEALALLTRGGRQVGRLVVTLGGEPVVFPLNYAVDGDAIVFRTQVGTKLSGISRSMVTFEVDAIDGSGQGWAVTFEGLAQEVLDADPAGLQARIAALALETWPGGDRPHVVRITPYRVHGMAWTAARVAAGATRP